MDDTPQEPSSDTPPSQANVVIVPVPVSVRAEVLGPSVLVGPEVLLQAAIILTGDSTQEGICCGSHYLTARLAIEHPSRPTIIDSVGCSRPTLFAPEPRLLILGSQLAPAGSHDVH